MKNEGMRNMTGLRAKASGSGGAQQLPLRTDRARSRRVPVGTIVIGTGIVGASLAALIVATAPFPESQDQQAPIATASISMKSAPSERKAEEPAPSAPVAVSSAPAPAPLPTSDGIGVPAARPVASALAAGWIDTPLTDPTPIESSAVKAKKKRSFAPSASAPETVASSAVVEAPKPVSKPKPAVPLSKEDADIYFEKGNASIEAGDLAVARLYFERLALGGDPRGAEGMGRTFDPDILAGLPVIGIRSDRDRAQVWYEKAQLLQAAL
jgi:hypothetical protein